MPKNLPQIDQELCTKCGLCVEACACGSLEMGATGPFLRCADDSSVTCPEDIDCKFLCEEVCPTGALQCEFDIVLAPKRQTGKACDAEAGCQGKPSKE